MRRSACWPFLLVFVCLCSLNPVFAAPPAQVWVDAHWTNAETCGGHVWQIDAFNRIQPALAAVAPKGTVVVAAGCYPEKLVIDKSLTLTGPGVGINPNAPTAHDPAAANPARTDLAKEAVIIPPAVDLAIPSGLLVEIRADDVTIDGLTLDGHNPALPDGFSLNGVTAHAACGVGEDGGCPLRVALLNNRIQNFQSAGIYFKNASMGFDATFTPTNVSHGNVIMHNRLDNLSAVAGTMPEMQPTPTGIGLYLYNNWFGQVLENIITRTAVGVWMANYHSAAGCVEYRRNAIQAYVSGIGVNTMNGGMDGQPDAVLSENQIQILTWDKPATVERHAVYLLTIAGGDIVVSDNTITGGEVGVQAWNINQSSHLVLADDTISGCRYGIVAANRHPVYGTAYFKMLTQLMISHVTIRDALQAGILIDDDVAGDGPLTVTITNTTTVTGGAQGMIVRGSRTALTLLGPSPLAFDGQTGPCLTLQYNGASAPGDLDLHAVTFGGKHRTAMTSAEVAAVRAKLLDHQVDPRVGHLLF